MNLLFAILISLAPQPGEATTEPSDFKPVRQVAITTINGQRVSMTKHGDLWWAYQDGSDYYWDCSDARCYFLGEWRKLGGGK